MAGCHGRPSWHPQRAAHLLRCVHELRCGPRVPLGTRSRGTALWAEPGQRRIPRLVTRPTCLGTTTKRSSCVTSCSVLAVSRTTMPLSPWYRRSACRGGGVACGWTGRGWEKGFAAVPETAGLVSPLQSGTCVSSCMLGVLPKTARFCRHALQLHATTRQCRRMLLQTASSCV